ncbi:DUF6232 family protein [Symbioplanes lichenis]|uniref:DUF6232 family protein n=1 Tax=Symbioplanes lichenis TaxID=1629072 RepID=UPI002739D753|nr:DUF6232 family protein [Actinoplanes lichenis]
MRIYYRGPDAMVTSEHFIYRTDTSSRTFLIRDLRTVTITESRTTGTYPVAFLLVSTAVVSAAAWPLWGSAPLHAVAAVGLTGFSVSAAVLLGRTRPRSWLLRATYRGQPTDLYESADPRVFNQVSRALRRAMEEADPLSAGNDLAAA